MNDFISLSHYSPSSRVLEGNRFLLGNGHLGYRGTFEEEGKAQMPGLNLVGVYDKAGNAWRESLNLPIPFCCRTFFSGKEQDCLTQEMASHRIRLDLEKGIFLRESLFPSYSIRSERFVSQAQDNLLASSISMKAEEEGDFLFRFGLDLDIFECNGPHFPEKKVTRYPDFLLFEGKTNEGKTIYEAVSYLSSLEAKKEGESFFSAEGHLKKGELFSLQIISLVFEEKADFHAEIAKARQKGFEALKEEHVAAFSPLYRNAKIKLLGDEEGQKEGNYSIYMLLILGDKNRARSVPARGVSGQTYKGAIFWDSEIFLLPFFCLQEPQVARNLLKYRIATVEGAKAKAKEFGYQGAFFAWESQDSGLEACSKYNVTDYKTGKPIRTYFNEKQIHISADIAYAFENYQRLTGDSTLLEEGGMELLSEIVAFYRSYATFRNGAYHLDDVIGPDEYHERVNDNAFTNYMAAHAIGYAIEEAKRLGGKCLESVPGWEGFLQKLYLPKPNADGVIEQFEGYFQKEDCSLAEVRSRVKDPKQYWGGKDGPASPTQIIKQADVVAMLVLLGDEFDQKVKKANYDYYFPRTEHGSSLSSSMYSLLATQIGESEYAYSMYRKSASIDLYGEQKLYAGGIYIGGSHPASEGGAYLCLVYGFSGFEIEGERFTLHPHLPRQIQGMEYSLSFRGKRYKITIQGNESSLEEVSL